MTSIRASYIDLNRTGVIDGNRFVPGYAVGRRSAACANYVHLVTLAPVMAIWKKVLRADVGVFVRRQFYEEFGTRTETKNLNSLVYSAGH